MRGWRRGAGARRNPQPAAAFAAAIALEAWSAIEPLQRQPWLGSCSSPPCCDNSARPPSRLPECRPAVRAGERGGPAEATSRLVATLEAIAAIAEAGLKDHDRWLTARGLLARKRGRHRSTSSLPPLWTMS